MNQKNEKKMSWTFDFNENGLFNQLKAHLVLSGH